jgi:N-terminal glutamine amidase
LQLGLFLEDNFSFVFHGRIQKKPLESVRKFYYRVLEEYNTLGSEQRPALQILLCRSRSGVGQRGVVIWDYHVVLVTLVEEEALVWDLDRYGLQSYI